MKKTSYPGRKTTRRLLSLLLCALMLSASLPMAPVVAAADYGGLTTEQPMLLVSGAGLVADGVYTSGNISNEKSYTIDELQSLGEDIVAERLYTANASGNNRRIYRGMGVDVAGLLALSGYTVDSGSIITTYASDGYRASANIGVARYNYPNFDNSEQIPVSAMLAWRNVRDGGTYPAASNVIPPTPDSFSDEVRFTPDASSLQLLFGQTVPDEIITNQFNSTVFKLEIGNPVTGVHLTVNGANYSRADLLMMPRADHTHTSNTRVRGVPLAYLLRDVADDAVIEFNTVDNWANIGNYTMTKGELVSRNAVMAYETWNNNTSSWVGYYNNAPGYFRLWVDGLSGAHAVNSIDEKPREASLYKHIDHAGAPYNIDAITSATLSVAGPGVVELTPVLVRELESTADQNIHRAVYSDSRGSGSVSFTYEGVTLLSILDGSINSRVERLDDDVVVVFQNRWRQDIGRLTYSEIKSAETPVIIAYGTAYANGTEVRPFVFNMGAGELGSLGNGDGPLKLVYDQSEFPDLARQNPRFGSVAYLYIEEGAPPPGFKHITATDEAYSNVLNTEYLVTFTGSALGREVSYTVKELEEMVTYGPDGKPEAGGIGHRDDYGLSNTTYWYVNQYEGVKVWDLLTRIGVDAETGKDDDDTLVSFSSWDNYQVSAQFSLKQLADPDLFYFYEKSPLDIGADRPTKEQLATPEYQPDNQVGDWTVDSNGYPVKKGYPVMLAYGLNGYPYVRDPNLPGYKSGLGNSGGPMRVIYGKTDGLNRSDPDAIENYAYFFNNGSQQLQRVQEVYVGDGTRYSTHMENPHPAYQSMKDDQALAVEIVSAGVTTTHTFTLAELESILYGPNISKSDRDTDGRQEKGYYFYNIAGGNNIQDLFEGVNLGYLLTQHIGLQGTLGSVELYSGNTLAATLNLAAINDKGKNSINQTDGLGMMVAFAKNGYPLVADRDDSGANGYVNNDPVTGKTIQNRNGPLMFVRGQTTGEYATGTINAEVNSSVNNLTKIVVNLDPDPFAHAGAEYLDYAGRNVLFSGAVRLQDGVNITVGALETMQGYMVTGSYTVSGGSRTYRGLDLFRLLNDRAVGASALMEEIVVIGSDSSSTTLTVQDLVDKRAILAYGIADSTAPDGRPLLTADGGPMRLIFDGGSGNDFIKDVVEIRISAAVLDGWKHNTGVFLQYADTTLKVSGQNIAYNKTYTVADLEDMDNIFVFDQYSMGVPTWVQGVDLYKLLQSIGFTGDLETSSFTANSIDNYPISFNGTQLKDGINGKPILIGFGQGTTQANGLPLVPNNTSPGYDPNVGNDNGPLRLFVHDNNGWCVKWLTDIVVGAAGGNPEPIEEKDFSIYGLSGGTVSYSIDDIKGLAGGAGIKTGAYTFNSTVTDTVTGALLYDILAANGVSDNAVITVNCTDGYETSGRSDSATYLNIPMSAIKEDKYFMAYEVNGAPVSDPERDRPDVISKVRIYREFDNGSTGSNRMRNIQGVTVVDFSFNILPGGADGIPLASARAVVTDSSGGIWTGSNGAGAAYISPTGEITTFSTISTPALKTNFVTGIAIAPDGSVWLTQGGSVGSQNAPPSAHYGFAKYDNGQFTFYDTGSAGSTLTSDCVYGIDVDKDGIVWVSTQHTLLNGGMEGGVTRFNPAANEWRTWTMDDGLPTVSAWAVKGDNNGGAWVTTYRTSNIELAWPDESYAYIGADGTVTSYEIPAGNDFTWSRAIAIDPDGGVYITRMSGAHDPANDGGWLDYIAPDGSVSSYKGDDLIPDLKAKARLGFYPEIRSVFADVGGDLWLSTNGLGVYRASVANGNITIIENYSSATGSWLAGAFDDVWSIYVSPDGKAVFGSNGGVVTKQFIVTPKPPPLDHIGDATPATAALSITGAVDKPGYFTLEGLKTYPGLTVYTRNYNTLNSVGTVGFPLMTGIYLEDLLKNVMQLADGATSITVTADDGFTSKFYLDPYESGVYWTNYEGNKLMLAWERDGAPVSLRAAVPQIGAGHVNNSLWVSNIVSITVNAESPREKPPQNAPTGLAGERPAASGGRGRIIGTAATMEYSDNQVNWVACANGFTEVFPGQYYIRYAETATHYASIAISLSVPAYQTVQPPPPVTGNIILTIYNGSTKVKEFTRGDIEALSKVTNNYSTYNSWPTYSSFTAVRGVMISTLLSEAGQNPSANTEITFYSSDGFDASLRMGDLTAARYYFDSSGNRGPAVPAVLHYENDVNYEADDARLYFGQLSAQEQTNQKFVKYVDRIVIGGAAGSWGTPTASPASGATVSAGDPIRLSLPTDSGDAKIYYTLDGRTPTVNSAMYNVTRWFVEKGITENPPIPAPSDGPFIIRAIIIGSGRNDGNVMTFYYNGATGDTQADGLPDSDGIVTIGPDGVPLTQWVENTFSDVKPTDWFCDSVRFVYERGLMLGTADDAFSPNLATSRGMVVTILYRLAGSPDIGSQGSGVKDQVTGTPFSDVPADRWYTDAVIWAAENGIVNGYGDGRFGPDDSITREQMAAILYRYAKYTGEDVSLSENAGFDAFTDAESVSPYAVDAMLWACDVNIIRGSDNKLDPRGNATRAQAAAILERYITGAEDQ